MECTDLVSRLLAKRPQDRLGAGSGSPGTPEEVTGIQQVQSHAWFSGLDWGALERKEVAPPYVPESGDELAHFPERYTSAPVTDADYKAPRVRAAALRRTSSGKDPFAEFYFVRREPELDALDEGVGEDEEGDDGEEGELLEADAAEVETASPRWEFMVRGGWEAMEASDQEALTAAYAAGKKVVELQDDEDGDREHSYRVDLERMVRGPHESSFAFRLTDEGCAGLAGPDQPGVGARAAAATTGCGARSRRGGCVGVAAHSARTPDAQPDARGSGCVRPAERASRGAGAGGVKSTGQGRRAAMTFPKYLDQAR